MSHHANFGITVRCISHLVFSFGKKKYVSFHKKKEVDPIQKAFGWKKARQKKKGNGTPQFVHLGRAFFQSKIFFDGMIDTNVS